MNKITLITKRTFLDDSNNTTLNAIKVCKNVTEAKESIINSLKEEFEDMDDWFGYMDDCNTLGDIARELQNSEIIAQCSENGFYWSDNGKGEEYHIAEIDLNYNGYQNIDLGDI